MPDLQSQAAIPVHEGSLFSHTLHSECCPGCVKRGLVYEHRLERCLVPCNSCTPPQAVPPF